MSTRLRGLGVFIAGVLALAGQWAGAPPARAQGAEPPSQVGALDVFVDQTGGTLGTGGISSYLPNLSPGPKSALAADDFVIPASGSNQFGRIQRITVIGESTGLPTIDKLFMRVYADAGNLPALAPSAFVEAAPVSAGAWAYVVDTLIIVPAGRRFWLSAQTNVTSANFATWNWRSTSTGGGTLESAWLDTTLISQNTYINDGLCALEVVGNWGQLRSICKLDADYDNLAFKLEGDIITLASAVFLPLVAR